MHFNYHLLGCANHTIPLSNSDGLSVTRVPHSQSLYLYHSDGSKMNGAIDIVNSSTLSTSPLPTPHPLPFLLHHSSSFVSLPLPSLVLFGGQDKDGMTNNSLCIIQLGGNINQESKRLSVHPRCGHSAAVIKEQWIVYFGGVDHEQRFLDDIFVLDSNTGEIGEWNIEGELPKPRAYHTATVVPSRRDSDQFQVFIFGGRDDKRIFGDMHVLDLDFSTKTITCSPLDRPLFPRYNHTQVLYEDMILFIGGIQRMTNEGEEGEDEEYYEMSDDEEKELVSSDIAIVFNTLVQQWSQCRLEGIEGRVVPSGHASVLVGEQILSFGGEVDEDDGESDGESDGTEPGHMPIFILDLESTNYKDMFISQQLPPFLGNPFYSDRKMEAEGRTINVQQSVVVSRVKAWESLFGEGFQESCSDIVTLQNCTFDSLLQMLIHIYGGEPDITGENFEDILRLSHLYSYHSLLKSVANIMLEALDVTNCASIIRVLVELDMRAEFLSMQGFISENIAALLQEDEFVEQLSSLASQTNYTQTLQRVLSSNVIIHLLGSPGVSIETVRALGSITGMDPELVKEIDIQPTFNIHKGYSMKSQVIEGDANGWIERNLHYSTVTYTPRGEILIDLGHKVFLKCSSCVFYRPCVDPVSVTIEARNDSSGEKMWEAIARTSIGEGHGKVIQINCSSPNMFRYFRVHCSNTEHVSLYGLLRSAVQPNVTSLQQKTKFELDFESECLKRAIGEVIDSGTVTRKSLRKACCYVFNKEFCESTLQSLAHHGYLMQVSLGSECDTSYCKGPKLTNDICALLRTGEMKLGDLPFFYP